MTFYQPSTVVRLSQKFFDFSYFLRGDRSNNVPNLRTLGLFLDTFPDGRVAGRAVWWRMDNSASSDQTELGFGRVCMSLAILMNTLKLILV